MAPPRDRNAFHGEIELDGPVPSSRSRSNPPAEAALDELELDIKGLRHSSRPPPPLVPPPPAPTPTRKNAIPAISLPDRTPDARGTLAQTPLAHVVVSLASRNLSGSVVIHVGDDLHALVFHEGAIVRTASPLVPLGEILATLGTLEEDEVEFAEHRAMEQGTPLGAQLVEDGLAEAETIETAVAAQIDERLAALAGLPATTTYAFYAGADVLEGYPVDVHKTDPLSAVMVCARNIVDDGPLDAVLSKLGDRRLAFHSSAQLPRFALTKDEAKAAEIIQWSWRPYAELVETLEDGHAALKRVAYALAITKHFDFGEESWPLGVPRPPQKAKKPPKPEPAPEPEPVAAAPEPAETVRPPAVAARASLTSAPTLTSPSQVLPRPSQPPSGLRAPLTPASGVRQADMGPVSRPPLGSQPPLERTPLPQSARGALPSQPEQTSPSRQQPAIEFLPLPPARTAMPSRPPSDAGFDASAIAAMSADERTIEAATLRQKAEVLLSRNDLVGAEKLAAQALELDKVNADSLGLLGWLRSMKPGPSSVADGLKLLDEAVKRNPQSDRNLFYRGSLLKRVNRADDAIRDFRKAAELNPRNIDAVREVRLHTIRTGGNEKAGTKRLIGKLFGK